MRKAISLVLALCIISVLCACGSNSTKFEPTEPIVSITDTIDTLLHGSWSCQSESFDEIFSFNNGSFSYKTIYDNIPGSGSDTGGSYEIEDGYIALFYESGYVNRLDYELNDNNLNLSYYVTSGSDAGTTRIFEQDYNYIDIPYAGSSQSTTQREPSKDTPKTDNTDNTTTGMRNALKAAKNYLSIMPFSYEGLIEQLEYEGYSHSEAVYGADNCDADWYEQAVKAAKNYLDIMAFSRSGLIEQLEYEGYTHDQAVYGVDKAY